MSRHPSSLSKEAQAFAELVSESDLVIFDFDGVIADSEVISLTTLRETLGRFGLALTAEETRDMFLGTSLKTITSFVKTHGTGDSSTFAHLWETTLFERFASELKPVDKVFDLLNLFDQADQRYCIASSGTFRRINTALKAMGRVDCFDHIFSAEQVTRGKPAPDLFEFAAKELGVAPAACVVIEDSLHGTRAARAARMRCVGFAGGQHLHGVRAEHSEVLRRAGASIVLSSFDEVARLDVAMHGKSQWDAGQDEG